MKSLKSLERKLDTIFSRYVRLRDADEGGTVQCVTCRKLMHWKDAHAGHFVKRQHRSLRWHPLNVAPQCAGCNVFRGGCQDEFAAHIMRKYGHETLDDLMRMKHRVFKPTRAYLEEEIARYQSLLSDMASAPQADPEG